MIGAFVFLFHSGVSEIFLIKKINWVVLSVDGHPVKEVPDFLKPQFELITGRFDELRGQSVFAVRLSDLNQKLAGQPWLKNAKIFKRWPDAIEVQANLTEVVALIAERKNRGQDVREQNLPYLFYPVTVEGEVLSAIKTKNAPDLIILKGSNYLKEDQIRQEAARFIKALPDKGVFSKESIAELSWDRKEGFFAEVLEKDLQVRLGFSLDEKKIKRIGYVINYLEEKKIESRVIDANFSKKVLVKPRKSP